MKINLVFFDKNNNLLKKLTLNEEETLNKRFKRKKSILDIALDNGIDLKYGCMGGSCSACICEIIKGGEFIDREGLHEIVFKGVKENEILTCIATLKDKIPKDNLIEIKLML
ncbi:MAG: (2Fe-2S)-binding protein [Nanoarchaeota archaeon]|nr:(2Fe-2S)-binding protein [Nanoarchaeota archaeon]